MKRWRQISITLFLTSILIGTVACNPLAGNKQTTQQEVKVTRGNLTVTVSGSGSLQVSERTDLYFGASGKVEKIFVEEGDNVTKGQVIAKLETGPLELALAQANVAYNQAQISVVQAQLGIAQAQTGITQAQTAVKTAEINLEKAQNTYKWPAIEIQTANVDKARASLQNAQQRLKDATTPEDIAIWTQNVALSQAFLDAEATKLSVMQSSADTDEVEIAKLQVESARQALTAANQSLALAMKSPDLAQLSLDATKKAVDQAQKQLNEATITAPFDGKVARVNVDEKDTVTVATTVINLIDTGTMELSVDVDEIDITSVKPGQKASVEVDAITGTRLEGKVISLSLLPKVEAGLVLYSVKVGLTVPQGIELRDGMSATADIVAAERTGVLLVPDRAITRDSQGKTTVQVTVNGQTEQRSVVTGISDGTQTEIIEGVKEGDTLIEKKAVQSSGPGLF